MAEGKRKGTQAVERVVLLLNALSTRRQVGWRLVDLAARCELDKGTAHRILTALIRHRMVVQRQRDRHYLPGPLLFELGLSLTAHHKFQRSCEASAARISKMSCGMGFFFLRSGPEMLCAARHTLVNAATVEPGMRRPLVSSAAGIAILVLLRTAERQAIVSENFEFIRRYGGDSIPVLKRMLRRSEKLGFGINESDLVPSWNTLGMAMCDPSGAPFGALMVAGPANRLSFDRLDHWVAMLRSEILLLEEAAARAGLWE